VVALRFEARVGREGEGNLVHRELADQHAVVGRVQGECPARLLPEHMGVTTGFLDQCGQIFHFSLDGNTARCRRSRPGRAGRGCRR
jgi:hypothetical protein